MILTPDYTIKLLDGSEVNLMYRFWGFRKLAEYLGIELEELHEKLFKMGKAGGLGLKDMPFILLAGHQTWCAFNKQECKATEFDASGWIDDMGGPIRGLEAFTDVMKVFSARFVHVSPDELTVSVKKVESEEKKSEAV